MLRRIPFTVPLCLALWLALAGQSAAAFTDNDNDGIPDDWEKNGVTVSFADGTTRFINLPQLGASPTHRDVIVWIYWLRNSDHSHKPVPRTETGPTGQKPIEQNAFDSVKASFKDQGINLIVLYSERPPIFESSTLDVIGAAGSTGGYDWKPLEDLLAPDLPVAPAGILNAIHICTFIHQMGGPGYGHTGLSKSTPGNEFIVSLARPGSATGNANEQAGTFMHELGHNLGLRHGGRDDTLYKPNYLSVMNYMFQATGLFKNNTFGNFNYSQNRIDLDEHAVDGSKGVSTVPSLQVWGYGQVCDIPHQIFKYFTSLGTPNRWDCTDKPPTPGSVPLDVNRDGCIGNLSGWNDWANLTISTNLPNGGAPTVTFQRPEDELSISQLLNLYASIKVPKLTVAPGRQGITVSWARVPLEAIVGYEVLRTAANGHTDIIRKTSKSGFIDTSAVPGVNYSYEVRTLVSGFSQEAIESAASLVGQISATASAAVQSILPLRRELSEELMRSLPSNTVRATAIQTPR